MPRTLRDRLIFELESIRQELIEAISEVQDLDYAPTPDMRTYRGQLIEIGATEIESSTLLRTGQAPTFKQAEAAVTGNTTTELLDSLSRIRGELLAWLRSLDDEQLRQRIRIPQSWAPTIGAEDVEREELVRWIARHEYYHLGQIISYRWIQGHNPYSD